MEWNFRSICSTPTLRGRGWIRPLRSTSQIWLILYNLQFEALHPRLFPPKCPPSHPCPLCHLARHHPHLLWTHIQVGNCIFFLPIFNLSFLSVLTRSTSLRIPMSGSRCKWISNFSLGATPPPALLPSPWSSCPLSLSSSSSWTSGAGSHWWWNWRQICF